jgi:hypothetical protein
MALSLYKKALKIAVQENIQKDVVDSYNGIAALLQSKGQSDSAIYYARTAYVFNKAINYKQGALQATV